MMRLAVRALLPRRVRRVPVAPRRGAAPVFELMLSYGAYVVLLGLAATGALAGQTLLERYVLRSDLSQILSTIAEHYPAFIPGRVWPSFSRVGLVALERGHQSVFDLHPSLLPDLPREAPAGAATGGSPVLIGLGTVAAHLRTPGQMPRVLQTRLASIRSASVTLGGTSTLPRTGAPGVYDTLAAGSLLALRLQGLGGSALRVDQCVQVALFDFPGRVATHVGANPDPASFTALDAGEFFLSPQWAATASPVLGTAAMHRHPSAAPVATACAAGAAAAAGALQVTHFFQPGRQIR